MEKLNIGSHFCIFGGCLLAKANTQYNGDLTQIQVGENTPEHVGITIAMTPKAVCVRNTLVANPRQECLGLAGEDRLNAG